MTHVSFGISGRRIVTQLPCRHTARELEVPERSRHGNRSARWE